jgi:predicted transcriptional regulator
MANSVGVYLDDDVIEQLDEIKRERDRLGREHASRSAVARDAISLGLVALDVFGDADPRAPPATQRTATRQALERHYDVDG